MVKHPSHNHCYGRGNILLRAAKDLLPSPRTLLTEAATILVRGAHKGKYTNGHTIYRTLRICRRCGKRHWCHPV
jgi:hypothetical protein